MDPLPAINRVYAMLITEEKQLSIGSSRVPIEAAAFAVKPSQKPSPKVNQSSQQTRVINEEESDKPICGHCGKLGHLKERCYELIGYPADWDTRGNRGRGLGGRQQQGTVHTATSGGGTSSSQQVAAGTNNQIPGLTHEQIT
ncbi:receptor-like serine/threonine kinase [Corchorus olitorius]|uniref:Receptor-like serine/threonine kinase n=1 Tax=Corchorus olitorius TaxID=93759 RepID=A0A1R3K9D9_9ROSI|nr:receptor-like serine/threonine kinase [Corchorus olitorius]